MHFEAAEGGHSFRRTLGLTPLIDVVFLLLIFFMLTTRFGVESELPLRLELDPAAVSARPDRTGSAAGSTSEHAALVLRLGADGTSWLAGERVAEDELLAHLAERLSAEPSRVVRVTPEGDVSVQRIIDTLDRVKRAGGQRVSLAEAR